MSLIATYTTDKHEDHKSVECYEDSDCRDVITLAAGDEENNHKKSHTLVTTDLIDYVVMTYYSIVIFY